jgi:hypothetical protein
MGFETVVLVGIGLTDALLLSAIFCLREILLAVRRR